ncbi:hypothetical protein [Actinosynnema sp. NPDC020468]|uniref:YciI family protein n=1 Tax=Actinosynnema sp. NPDC020468 TaxID=3154488 RepID=UPI0033C11C50
MISSYGSRRDYEAMAGVGVDAWSPERWAEVGALMEAFNRELAESGELVETRAFTSPADTRRLTLVDGVPAVTDDPAGEGLSPTAYWVVDCPSLDRAIGIARRLLTEGGTVDVRPIAGSRHELAGSAEDRRSWDNPT